MDAGYDENSNPFANVSDAYAKKREEALKKQKQKKISARARQVRKVRNQSVFDQADKLRSVSGMGICVQNHSPFHS